MTVRFLKKTAYFAEYVLLRMLVALLSIIPRTIALRFGSLAGALLYKTGFYRRIAEANLAHVALWNSDEQARILRQLYSNIGKYAVDFLRPTQPLPPHTLENFDDVKHLMNMGKGTIVILGHLGNWELLASVFGSLIGKLSVVAKPMQNPFVESWLYSKRSASEVTTIYSSQALRKMLTSIKNDGVIAILIDQFMRKHGNPVPFLGKMAITVNTVAGLAQKTGCNVISISSILKPDGSYAIKLYLPPEQPAASTLTDEEQILMMQTVHNQMLSEQIIANPSHWFGWFHKRFRGYITYKS